MKTITGYIIKKNGEVIGATSDERKALYIAKNRKGISYRVETTIDPKHDAEATQTVAYDGTI